jgi:SAM-dependent methyltransferase
MPLVAIEAFRGLLACPRCGGSLTGSITSLVCSRELCNQEYVAVGEPPKPVLIDTDKSIVNVAALVSSCGASAIQRSFSKGLLYRFVMRLLINHNSVAEHYMNVLAADLVAETKGRPLVLIIGGGSIGSGADSLYQHPDLDLVAFDIYASDNVQFLADGHQLPFKDQSVDGVLIQAVLEHVLDPYVVVAEIHRVLRPQGLVYAETPFMQHVHEGQYDFTRFTDSGHRYLFRNFAARSSGTVAGLGTQLLWSIIYFSRGIHRRVAQIAHLLFFWLPRLDPWLDTKATVDGASGFFFYGHSSPESMSPTEIVNYYSGAQGSRADAQKE